MTRHGHRSTYTSGCHCPPCRAANTRYAQQRRSGLRPERQPVPVVAFFWDAGAA